MNRDPELAIKFANTMLEELAAIRGELISQRKLLIDLSSKVTHERRRKVKNRAYGTRLRTIDIARELKQRAGLTVKDEE